MISTGGGVALREENRRIMKDHGYIVLIDRPIDDINDGHPGEKLAAGPEGPGGD